MASGAFSGDSDTAMLGLAFWKPVGRFLLPITLAFTMPDCHMGNAEKLCCHLEMLSGPILPQLLVAVYSLVLLSG